MLKNPNAGINPNEPRDDWFWSDVYKSHDLVYVNTKKEAIWSGSDATIQRHSILRASSLPKSVKTEADLVKELEKSTSFYQSGIETVPSALNAYAEENDKQEEVAELFRVVSNEFQNELADNNKARDHKKYQHAAEEIVAEAAKQAGINLEDRDSEVTRRLQKK